MASRGSAAALQAIRHPAVTSTVPARQPGVDLLAIGIASCAQYFITELRMETSLRMTTDGDIAPAAAICSIMPLSLKQARKDAMLRRAMKTQGWRRWDASATILARSWVTAKRPISDAKTV